MTSDWVDTTIGELAVVTRGASPRPIASDRWFDDAGKVGWVRIADVNRSNGRELKVTSQRLSEDGILRSRFLESGTLILSIAASVGIPVITRIPACIHDGFVALTSVKADQKFMLYLLKAAEGRLKEAGQSGSQMNINSDIVRGLPVRIPADLAEQKAISSALWEKDDLISSLERLISKKQAMKQGMIQQLLSGATRLDGFTRSWDRTRLGTVLKFQVGYPFPSSGFSKSASGMRLVRNRDLRSNDSVIFFSGVFSEDFILGDGDILVGMDGDFEPIIWRGGPALLNQRVGRLILSRHVNGAYLSYALEKPLLEMQNSTGATTVKHLSHRDVEDLSIPLPPVEEQEAIAQILQDADQEIAALKRRLESARSIKQGMMQELLTGRTRLPVEEVAS
ncbi:MULTISPECIES: restriction endonuclease subunit S [Corynebacterium]|uniref:restriction endonuclease subunit S n=1 Tax=Corynebacterium TaxID=1716 RepID=UPI0009F65F96|nr:MULTISPECIES: restriction endonuclease subunit S [unclassified Corynebacterium]